MIDLESPSSIGTGRPRLAEPGEPRPSRVVMIGAFPPPIGGAARNNAMLAQSLLDGGAALVKFNVSGDTASHHRTLGYHARRLARNARATLKAIGHRTRDGLLYVVPDGGAGAWYTLAHIRAAARGYQRLVLHHHTFRYINHYSRPVDLFVRASPAATTHIFLSEGMARAFRDRYGPVDYRVASNARFVADEAGREPEPRVPGRLRLGHLSNLSDDKGFFEVAETYEALRARGHDAELHLAGPVLSEKVEAKLQELLSTFGDRVRHHGPVFGIEKRDFYRAIDLFVFPTNFDQEAAPSVIYESLAAGRPVLTTQRGCISEMVFGDRGAILPARAGFAPAAVEFLETFDADDEALLTRARSIKQAMKIEAETSKRQYGELMALLGARDPGHMVQEY